MISENLGFKLKQERLRKGFSRDFIAERVGKGTRHIAAIENGDRNASIEVLFQMIRTLGISVDDLVYPEKQLKHSEDEELFNQISTLSDSNKRLIQALVHAMLSE